MRAPEEARLTMRPPKHDKLRLIYCSRASKAARTEPPTNLGNAPAAHVARLMRFRCDVLDGGPCWRPEVTHWPHEWEK
jgi:hypothetical protein